MEVDSLLIQAFRIVLGHKGFMIPVLTWAIFSTLILVAIRLYEEMR